MSNLTEIADSLFEAEFLEEYFVEDSYLGKPSYSYETEDILLAVIPDRASDEITLALYDYNNDVEVNVVIVETEDALPELCENLISAINWWVTEYKISSDCKQSAVEIVKVGRKHGLLNEDYEPIVIS